MILTSKKTQTNSDYCAKIQFVILIFTNILVSSFKVAYLQNLKLAAGLQNRVVESTNLVSLEISYDE